jgi:alkylated DNA repair dioxygenase AlkB
MTRPPAAARSGTCPLCGVWYAASFLPIHASSCTTERPTSPARSSRLSPASTPSRPELFTPTLPRPPHPFFAAAASSERPRRLPASYQDVDTRTQVAGVPGFHVFYDFLSCELEHEIVAALQVTGPDWIDARSRRFKPYGPVYSFTKKTFVFGPKQTPLPSYATNIVLPLVKKVVPQSVYPTPPVPPNQLLINEYDSARDTYILPHSDCENTIILDPILGLCCGAECTMTLILPKSSSPTGVSVKHDVLLPRRCLYVMGGESLNRYHHGIFSKKTERGGIRYSLTFRRTRPPTSPAELRTVERKDDVDLGNVAGRKRMRQTLL